jgi:hypothetical protein
MRGGEGVVAREKKRGYVRDSLGVRAGNVPLDGIDESAREMLGTALFAAPGTTERRGRVTKAKASQQKLPGRTVRAERAAADKVAAEQATENITLEQMFAAHRAQEAAKARGMTQRMVNGLPVVWQCGRWSTGLEDATVAGKTCPDAKPAFEDWVAGGWQGRTEEHDSPVGKGTNPERVIGKHRDARSRETACSECMYTHAGECP